MDSTTFTIGASVVLVLSLVIYQVGKPTPLPLIPHNKLPWFVGDIPFLTRLAKEKGAITYAFDDTAMRLGPVSQVRGHRLIPAPSLIFSVGRGWTRSLLGQQTIWFWAGHRHSRSTFSALVRRMLF
jgi:hypothetical protein